MFRPVKIRATVVHPTLPENTVLQLFSSRNYHVDRVSRRLLGLLNGRLLSLAQPGRSDSTRPSAEVVASNLVKKQIKEKEPSYDIFKHDLVPKHVLLKPNEAKEVLERYHIKPFQIPYVKSTDPAVRAIGAKPGDIVKVIRKSATAGESDFYRYVVEDF